MACEILRLDLSVQCGWVNATTCPQFSVHVNYHFDSDYITAFNSRLKEIISNLIHNTWTPSSLGKLTLHITPGVLLVLFSPRIRGRTGSAHSRSACSLMYVLWLHWHLLRPVYLLQKKLASAAGERFADLPVMSYVEWFSRISERFIWSGDS